MHRRRALRVGRIGNVPLLDRGGVDPGREQPTRLGRPPKTPVPVELLGRHEVGLTPGDVLVVLPRELAVVRTVRRAYPNGPSGKVGDDRSVRRQARVEDVVGQDRSGGGAWIDQVGDEQAPLDREAGEGQVFVGGERRDAVGRLSEALAVGLLGLGQRSVEGGEQGERVGDEPFGWVLRPPRPPDGRALRATLVRCPWVLCRRG